MSLPCILLIGSNGQVGWELQRSLSTLGQLTIGDRRQIDLCNPDTIKKAISNIKPNLIVNAAAYTAVDKAEDEPDIAMAINGVAPGVIAEEAKRIGAAMVHYSTDYVYDGSGDKPWKETDPTGPLSVYGRTKLEGDIAIQASGVPHLILRTSWVFGIHGNNFVKTMLRLGAERKELSIINDQFGSPTSARVIADITGQILAQAQGNIPLFLGSTGGIVHLCCQTEISWHGFAMEIFRQAEKRGINLMVEKVHAISSDEYPTRAVRPGNSRLDCQRLREVFSLQPPAWQVALEQSFPQS